MHQELEMSRKEQVLGVVLMKEVKLNTTLMTRIMMSMTILGGRRKNFVTENLVVSIIVLGVQCSFKNIDWCWNIDFPARHSTWEEGR